MPGDSVYKDHTFEKETEHKSQENGTIHRTNFRSTILVHEHKYNTSTLT
jgi:hypothetical protein